MPEKTEFDWQIVKQSCIVLLLSLLPVGILQSPLRRYLRRRKLQTADPRQRLLAYWQEAVLLADCLGTEPDSRLRELAERAKFSPHLPTEQAFAAFESYLAKGKKQLKRQKLFRRLYNYFVRAV
jgi:hypothetical protein